MNTTHTTAAAIKDAQSAVEWAKKRVSTIRKNGKKIQATLDLLNQRLHAVDATNATIYAWVDCNGYDGIAQIQARITATTDSMVEGIVPQILKAMLDIECEPVESKDIVNADQTSRTYRFKRAAAAHFVEIDLSVVVTIKETETGTCRRVQTGTRIVEVAEYKIECEGATT